MALSVADVDRALAEGLGFGFAGVHRLGAEARLEAERAVVEVMNDLASGDLGFGSYEDLTLWVDSKYGRWCADELSGLAVQDRDSNRLFSESIRVVRVYLGSAELSVLRSEVLASGEDE